MTDPIEKVDLKSSAEKLIDKIRLEFANAITRDQWHKMIENELKTFTQPREERDRYHNKTNIIPSVFSSLCQDVLKEEARKALTQLISENKNWNNEISDLVKDWMTENSQKILETAILGFCQSAAQNFINNMHT